MANTSSSASSTLSSGSIIAKKLLKKREPPRAHTVIKSSTIYPSTAPKSKVDYSHVPVMVLAPENPLPIKLPNELPTICYSKKAFYRTWMPLALGGY